MRNPLVALAASLVVIAGCGNDDPHSNTPPPAKVQAPVKEADLTTVTLTPEAEQRLGIKTAAIERKALSRTRTIGGEVVPAPGAEMVVTAPAAGTLQTASALPAPGSYVSRGQTILRLVPIAPSDRDARVDAERTLGEAAARHDVALKKTRRAEQLLEDGAGSRRAFEEAQAELRVAEAELKAAKDRVALAERGHVGAAGIGLEAPITSLVRAMHVSSGQTVAAGAPLFELVRLDSVWIRVPLYAGESGQVDPSAGAHIVALGEPADSPGVFAKPVTGPPSADPQTAAVDLYFAMANRGLQFRPGERVAVRLTRRGESTSLVVPKAALLEDAYGGTWVYEARGGHVFVRRRVAVADIIDTVAVLSQGPPPGTRIVTDGAAELFGTEFGVGK